MASTRTTRLRPNQASSPNGNSAHTAVTLAPPPRRVRLPGVVIGVLITAVFGLGAVLWHLSAVEKSPALAAAGSIERGAIITAADVQVVYVATDDPVARLDDSQMAQVIGRVAVTDLAAGTLLTPSVVVAQPGVNAGEGVVGLSLDPGGYPALGLSPGDRVNVVRTASALSQDEDLALEDAVIVRHATVFAVEELASDRRLVSVLASEAEAESIASAAGAGSLRLVLVSP